MDRPSEGGERCAPVIVVGSVNADLVVTTERLPRPGETVTGGTFARHWGGKGANQAVAAARYGARVELVGAVGDDDLGAGARGALEREGVGTAHLEVADAATGVALIVVEEGGENQIAVAPGANRLVEARDLDRLLEGPGAPRPGAVLTGFEIPEAVVAAVLRLGAAAGWRVVVDPAPARPLTEAFADSGAVLTPNRGELLAICRAAGRKADGDAVETSARWLAEEVTGGPVLVTLGGDGALLVAEGQVRRLAPPSVVPRDTTGAGDACAGVLGAALAEGRDLLEAAELAVAAGAIATEAEGARAGMPTGAALRARLAAAR